jgi:FkbM family methyltransferase
VSRPPLVAAAVRAIVPRSARNWLRDPRRSIEWGVDHARFTLGRVERIEVRPGWTVQAHPLAARCAFGAQVHDPEQRCELDAFIARCTPGMRLLDVGAHFGIFSLAAAHFGGPDARVLAVDPSAAATKMLARHARLNGCGDRVAVVTACAAAAAGERGMLDTGVIGAGYFVAADSGRRAADLSRVTAVRLDDLCAAAGFRPTHVKIDVEGDELEVLRGAAAILTREVPPLVFLELHDAILHARGGDATAVVEWLSSRGYRIEPVSGQAGTVRRLVAVPNGSAA